MDQACFWVCSSPESDGVEIWLKRIVASTITYNITCDLLKKIPRPVGSQKVNKSTLLQKDFNQEKSILQNLDFQLFQRTSHWCGKTKIYKRNGLGSMLVSHYVSEHARLATAASTIPSGFWELGSLGASWERMRAGCMFDHMNNRKNQTTWVPCW